MKSDSTFRNAPYNTGYIYLVYRNDFPKAADYFSKAIEVDPAYFEAWFNRGYANELMGKYDQAVSDYKKALQIQVNYPKAIDGLNRIDALRRKH
jgi:tetratricopeptide (TPR) repeat protein